jgi:hypothetical protein
MPIDNYKNHFKSYKLKKKRQFNNKEYRKFTRAFFRNATPYFNFVSIFS